MRVRPVAGALTVLVVVVAFSVADLSWAKGRYGRHGKTPSIALIWSDLSADQKKQVDQIKLGYLKKTLDLKAQKRKLKVEMLEPALADSPDEQALEKKRDELWALKDKIRAHKRDAKKQLRKILTPEQRKEVGPFGPKLGRGFGFGTWRSGRGEGKGERGRRY